MSIDFWLYVFISKSFKSESVINRKRNKKSYRHQQVWKKSKSFKPISSIEKYKEFPGAIIAQTPASLKEKKLPKLHLQYNSILLYKADITYRAYYYRQLLWKPAFWTPLTIVLWFKMLEGKRVFILDIIPILFHCKLKTKLSWSCLHHYKEP